jgi:hypothetical protein
VLEPAVRCFEAPVCSDFRMFGVDGPVLKY